MHLASVHLVDVFALRSFASGFLKVVKNGGRDRVSR